jgi:hypothetical protein
VLRAPHTLVCLAALAGAAITYGCSAGTRTTVLHPGLEATSFLTSSVPAMVIEVTPVDGRVPDAGALELLVFRASQHCAKPGGIQLVVDPVVPATAPVGTAGVVRSLADLEAFAAAHRRLAGDATTAVLYIEYVDGTFEGTARTLGASFGPDAIAVFKDQIVASFPDAPGSAESRVLVHELGHELGLVNEGAPMVVPHEDPLHPAHCVNPSCVMFWTLHSASADTSQLPPDDYDDNCKADLRAAGGL